MTRAEAQAKAIESMRKAKENLAALRPDMIADLWQAGLDQKTIAKTLGIHRTTVQGHLKGVCTKEDRIARQKRGQAHRAYTWTPEMDAALLSLRAQGKSYQRCGDAIGVTKNAAMRRMRDLMVDNIMRFA